MNRQTSWKIMRDILSEQLKAQAALFLGWRYARAGMQQDVPYKIEGFPDSLVNTGTNAIDCSTFVAWLLMDRYYSLRNREAYEALQIFDPAVPYSNIAAICTAEAGETTHRAQQQRWHLVQTWEGTAGQSAGHSRLAYCDGSDTALCLESTISSAADGPQWRRIRWDDLQSRAGCEMARLY